MEIWKDIPDWEGLYQVSNKGRVKSLPRFAQRGTSPMFVGEKILKPRTSGKPNKEGKYYLAVILCKDGYRVQQKIHILVATVFIPNPNKLPCVLHANDDPEFNEVGNLSWGTVNDNNADRNQKGRTYQTPSDNGYTNVLIPQDITDIRQLLDEGNLSQQKIADIYGLHQATISKIKLGKIWPSCQA